MAAKWQTPHLPDADMLAAVGAVSVRHSFLDHVLKRTVKTLAGLSVDEADKALARDGSAVLRELVLKLAKRRLGSASVATLKLKAILSRCEQVSEQRNSWIHNVWAVETGGEQLLIGPHGSAPVPTAAQVKQLADEIYSIATELNAARLSGFLAEALLTVDGKSVVNELKKP
jgi:hypothetical protein